MPANATHWSFTQIDDVFSAITQPGFISMAQFAAENAEMAASGQCNGMYDVDQNNRGDFQRPEHDYQARMQLSSIVNSINGATHRTPIGQLRTANQVLSDHTTDHEAEITRMMRNAGIEREQSTFRPSLSRTRRSVLTGSEPLAVAGLKDVFVDDNFFEIQQPTDKPEETNGDGTLAQPTDKVADVKGDGSADAGKTIPKGRRPRGSKSKKPHLGASFSEKTSTKALDKKTTEVATAAANDRLHAIGSSVKYYTPREVYEKRRFNLNKKVISMQD